MAKILLVEDNEVYREVMVMSLQRRGHALVNAADGRKAMEKLDALMELFLRTLEAGPRSAECPLGVE